MVIQMEAGAGDVLHPPTLSHGTPSHLMLSHGHHLPQHVHQHHSQHHLSSPTRATTTSWYDHAVAPGAHASEADIDAYFKGNGSGAGAYFAQMGAYTHGKSIGFCVFLEVSSLLRSVRLWVSEGSQTPSDSNH